MKKILTLLLLAAFFAMPKSVYAVEWEVSDGTQYRINPNNPSDPNDSILIPAGTEFCRIWGGKDASGRRYLILYYVARSQVNYRPESHICYFNSTDINYSYRSESDVHRINFSDNALRIRLTERVLGYNYAGFSTTSGSAWDYKTDNIVNLKAKLDYLRKVVITKEEARVITSISLNPKDYGLIGTGSIYNIDGLEIFENLEELSLANNPYLSTELHYIQYVDSWTKEGPYYVRTYKKELINFKLFTKLKQLDMSNTTIHAKYFFDESTAVRNETLHRITLNDYFPHTLKRLIWHNFVGEKPVNLQEYTNLEYLDFSNSNINTLILDTLPLLESLILNNAKISVLRCQQTPMTVLDLSRSTIRKLYCSNGMLETLKTNPFLEYVDCQDNNLTTLYFTAPVLYPTKDYYLDVDASGNKGSYYSFYNSCIIDGDTISTWTKRTFYFGDREYSNILWYRSLRANFYDQEYKKYVFLLYDLDSEKEINPNIPVTYTMQLPACNSLVYLDCSKNNITNLELPYANNLQQLYCWNNKLTSLDLTACTSLQKLRMSHNKIPEIDLSKCLQLEVLYAKNRIGEPGVFANWNHGLTSLDCSGLAELREVRLSRNKMTSLDMSGCSSLETLSCDNQGGSDARTLEVLNLTGCSNLTSLDCQNNALTSLDLSSCLYLSASGVKGYVQRAEKDVKVIDRDKVCIELPNGVTPTIEDNGTISDIHMDNYFGTWAAIGTSSGFYKERNKVIKRDDKTYLVIHDISDDARGGAQTKADVDLYGKQMKYQYALSPDNWDETLGGSLANSKKNDNVTVTIYPYVMYVNPISKDIHSEEVTQQGKEPFYSGTIYLDYDAIVPAGATAYIAKKIKIKQDLIYSTAGGGHQKVTADQLQLVPLVAGEGATEVVIPANTPVYIKSDTEFGLFSFDRNNHGGIEQALGYAQDGSHLINDNILKGTLTDLSVQKHSVLSLGRGRPKGTGDEGYTTESRIGFWPFSGTTIPAHRVYIPMSELENAGGSSSSPGLLFSFTDDINENNTTDIRTAVINKAEGWYTIGGVRLSGRPTEKGVYIHNGRKEVIR